MNIVVAIGQSSSQIRASSPTGKRAHFPNNYHGLSFFLEINWVFAFMDYFTYLAL